MEGPIQWSWLTWYFHQQYYAYQSKLLKTNHSEKHFQRWNNCPMYTDDYFGQTDGWAALLPLLLDHSYTQHSIVVGLVESIAAAWSINSAAKNPFNHFSSFVFFSSNTHTHTNAHTIEEQGNARSSNQFQIGEEEGTTFLLFSISFQKQQTNPVGAAALAACVLIDTKSPILLKTERNSIPYMIPCFV